MTLPSVSVAICTRDRPSALERCVASVCAQNYMPIEIIIIDDGRLSTEFSQRLAKRVTGSGVQWRYFTKSETGLTRSRNLALAEATGQIVVFLDDDAEAEYNYLSEVAAIFAADSKEAIAVLGGTLIEPTLGGVGGHFWRAGAALAGWWRLGIRGMRRGPWPDAVRSGHRVVPTLALSGAALPVEIRLETTAERFDRFLARNRTDGLRLGGGVSLASSEFWVVCGDDANELARLPEPQPAPDSQADQPSPPTALPPAHA